jgi:hypothetical protein
MVGITEYLIKSSPFKTGINHRNDVTVIDTHCMYRLNKQPYDRGHNTPHRITLLSQ